MSLKYLHTFPQYTKLTIDNWVIDRGDCTLVITPTDNLNISAHISFKGSSLKKIQIISIYETCQINKKFLFFSYIKEVRRKYPIYDLSLVPWITEALKSINTFMKNKITNLQETPSSVGQLSLYNKNAK